MCTNNLTRGDRACIVCVWLLLIGYIILLAVGLYSIENETAEIDTDNSPKVTNFPTNFPTSVILPTNFPTVSPTKNPTDSPTPQEYGWEIVFSECPYFYNDKLYEYRFDGEGCKNFFESNKVGAIASNMAYPVSINDPNGKPDNICNSCILAPLCVRGAINQNPVYDIPNLDGKLPAWSDGTSGDTNLGIPAKYCYEDPDCNYFVQDLTSDITTSGSRFPDTARVFFFKTLDLPCDTNTFPTTPFVNVYRPILI